MLFGISFVQWVFIVIGIAIVVVPYLGHIMSFFTKKTNTQVVVNETSDVEGNALTNIVHKWELLEAACKKANLEEACVKLNEVFPLLIKTK